MKTRLSLIAVVALLVAACGGEDTATQTTEDGTTTTAAPTTTVAATTTEADGPPTGPADITFESQTSDGTSITVSSVTLPTDGYVVVHADADGNPGAVIGYSDLLPEGTSTDVTVTFGEPLTESQTVFPMAHIDANGNGEYEFFPPDDTTDVPATFEDGSVAVVGGEVTVESGGASAAQSLAVASSDLGDIVTDAEGFTLYVFQPDEQGDSTCYGTCEDTWPPLVGEVEAGDGIDAALLGSSERTDGSLQVTYDGWPLYYFAADGAPGDTNGQLVGDVWFVIAPDGTPIREG